MGEPTKIITRVSLRNLQKFIENHPEYPEIVKRGPKILNQAIQIQEQGAISVAEAEELLGAYATQFFHDLITDFEHYIILEVDVGMELIHSTIIIVNQGDKLKKEGTFFITNIEIDQD